MPTTASTVTLASGGHVDTTTDDTGALTALAVVVVPGRTVTLSAVNPITGKTVGPLTVAASTSRVVNPPWSGAAGWNLLVSET